MVKGTASTCGGAVTCIVEALHVETMRRSDRQRSMNMVQARVILQPNISTDPAKLNSLWDKGHALHFGLRAI